MPEPKLTPREIQVLRYVRAGASNKEIASDLHISEQAVKALVSRLLAKYGVPNRTTLAAHTNPREHGENALRNALDISRGLQGRSRALMNQLGDEVRGLRKLRAGMAAAEQRRKKAAPSSKPSAPGRPRAG